MISRTEAKQMGRERRHKRIRAKIIGSAVRPRLSVYKSNRYLHAQIIDDASGKTLVAGSTKDVATGKKKMDAAKLLGADLAKRAGEKGIKEVVFDRGGFRYTGRVEMLAQAAREAGLKL